VHGRFPSFSTISAVLLSAGSFGALLSNGMLLLRRTRKWRILLIPPGAALILYLPVLALTLIMLV